MDGGVASFDAVSCSTDRRPVLRVGGRRVQPEKNKRGSVFHHNKSAVSVNPRARLFGLKFAVDG